MSAYKLTYFEAKGVAEVSRLALAVAGVNYEDIRVSQEDWPTQKPKFPQGKLPVLEAGSNIFPQSRAILRFIAREHGLYGIDNIQNTEVDVIIETVQDLSELMFRSVFDPNEQKKAELYKELMEQAVPSFAGIFERILENKAWLVGGQLTIADLAVFNVFDYINHMSIRKQGPSVYTKYPVLKSHTERVKSNEKVKAWLDMRPDTVY